MNLDELTIGQVKRLLAMFSGMAQQNQAQPQSSDTRRLARPYLGECVIVRSRNEGINFGILTDADETGVVLKNARRIWWHKPADSNMAWYEGVALSGLGEGSKVSPTVSEKVIVENYSITVCDAAAAEQIERWPSHGLN